MEHEKHLYPVYREIPADLETPVSAYLALKEAGKMGFLLESVETGDRLGRYSFLGFDPLLSFQAKNGHVTMVRDGKKEEYDSADPIQDVKKLAAGFREHRLENMPPFTAGLVGYFSYDAVRYFEKLPDVKPDRMKLPDIQLFLPKVLVAFDHILSKITLITYTERQDDTKAAEAVLAEYEKRLSEARRPTRMGAPGDGPITLTSNFKKEDFLSAVEKAKSYIVAGDIFQVVLSQKFMAKTARPPFEIYRRLRTVNPSPYLYYFDYLDFQVIGSSPEVMVKREHSGRQDEVLVRPIAGTRPRGKTADIDRATEEELLKDQKELAEHTMLLDLARNDVGRVSEYGSVRVEAPFHIERYSHVMHIVSDVRGRTASHVDSVDVIGATFPAGTVSGSPKVRAMEIIEELEPEKRGIYAGAIGYLDFRGNMDTCIAIRTIVYKDQTAYLQAGAGIVYDSVPEKEYEETFNKARALMKALV